MAKTTLADASSFSKPRLGFECHETYLLTFGAIKTIWSTDDDIIGRRIMVPDLPEDTMIFDIDAAEEDPSFCSRMAADLFKNLLSDEDTNRPRSDYIENVQKRRGMTPLTRALCVNRFIIAAEKLSLSPDTLHLSINCWDRYLSENEVDVKNLYLSGLTCLIIASKYIEIKTANTFNLDAYLDLINGVFSKTDFIQMEDFILKCLDYKVGSPTAWSFLERFVRAANNAGKVNPPEKLGSLASYLAEVSLLSYPMVEFKPSMVAASCVFLALYIHRPCNRPWTETLKYYTGYQASDLRDCVVELHGAWYDIQLRRKLNVRMKYPPEKSGCVGSSKPTYFPAYIPYELFKDGSSV